MKMKLLSITLALCVTLGLSASALATKKALAAGLFAAIGLAQGGTELATGHCTASCPWNPDFDAFGDYLADLSNCEKQELLPIMSQRYAYMLKSQEFFQDDPNIDNPMQAEKSLGDILVIHQKELLLLEAEFKKTQSMLFSNCISEESQAALAKHLSVLTHAIEEHQATIEYLKEQME